MMPSEPMAPAAAPSPSPSPTEQKLDAVLGSLDSLASLLAGVIKSPAPVQPEQPSPSPVSQPRGLAGIGQPVQVVEPPAPPRQHATPHADETMAPGDLAYYSYRQNGDPEGTERTQLVLVTDVTDQHVHGIVLGDARQVASFGVGVLTHEYPAGS